MSKRKKLQLKKEVKRFLKKFFFRMLSRILELITLFGIGYALGLKLIRY